MENKISQKAFDSHLHIIRDPRFDIDKYKVGELYVINNTLRNIIDDVKPLLFQKSKIIGLLQNVDDTSLTFRIICIHQDPQYISIYEWNDITLSIDTIIDHRIEIERLLTETEAAVYLGLVVLDEAKQSTLDPKDPKFNRLLGIVPDWDQFPHTLERTHSYQELQAAYKINTPEEAAEIAKDSQMNIVNDIMKAAEEEKKNYVVWLIDSFSGLRKSFSILDSEGNFDPEPFKGLSTGSGRVRVKLVKGNSTVQFNVHSKYIKVASDVIAIIGNKNRSSICMTLMKDIFREMFDKIEFEQIQ
ncbi:MAG: hypothetical protein IKU29_04095 [Parabacteroides sp.]|nr:hypothetical protein [Parabacteroides sp.]